MSTKTTQLLAEMPLFASMDDEERSQLRAIMRERSFQPGQIVMAASDQEASFFIVEQGEMEVWLTDTDGKKVVLEVLGPGKVFGDMPADPRRCAMRLLFLLLIIVKTPATFLTIHT